MWGIVGSSVSQGQRPWSDGIVPTDTASSGAIDDRSTVDPDRRGVAWTEGASPAVEGARVSRRRRQVAVAAPDHIVIVSRHRTADVAVALALARRLDDGGFGPAPVLVSSAVVQPADDACFRGLLAPPFVSTFVVGGSNVMA